jgi:hypothetical protein
VGEACFSPASLALLAAIWLVIQAAIVALFWIGIRAYQDSIRDARELRDRALDINERALQAGERQVDQVGQVLRPRGRR